jgi:hypothetical protein
MFSKWERNWLVLGKTFPWGPFDGTKSIRNCEMEVDQARPFPLSSWGNSASLGMAFQENIMVN